MKMNTKTLFAGLLCSFSLLGAAMPENLAANTSQTYLPEQTARHEGTWLQWPHHYTYGKTYRNRLDQTWVDMTRALVRSENVYIIVYNGRERRRISQLLTKAGVALDRIRFTVRRTDDVWVRDNGPMFVFNARDELQIADWGFNGWGLDAPYRKDDKVPAKIQRELGLARLNLNDIILEGGSVEVDGNGTLMTTRSAVLEPLRNPAISEAEMEEIFSAYLGADKVIWLDGAPGGNEDITDTHIDGFARFANGDTIVTMNRNHLFEWGLSSSDINTLLDAKDIYGVPYDFVHLPLTRNNVRTAYGKNLGYKGSYVNYYVANSVVLMPAYQDPNDEVARQRLQQLYPGREVVKIDVRNLYENGGMVNCVTQQQPAAE